MKTELLEVSPTQKEITIEIEPEEVREVYNNVSKKYAKAAQVDGFRKGYAPLDVIRLRYNEEIKSEVLQELFSPKVGEAIQEYNLNPLSEPHLHIENSENLKVNGSQPISLRVHVEVMPEIPAPEYKNLEVTRRVRPLSDDELSRIIDERRQESATLIPIEDRKSQDGDTVIVDLEGTFADDETSEPIKADNLEIKLGDANIEKSFTENLVGVEEDEEKEFTVAYAPDFTSPMLAGKTVNYKAKIKSVGKV
ncbi:MAG: trigger factor, partial [Acidobacteria bacterium]|nr:trigger factor [Acidobacteriota bacterium]